MNENYRVLVVDDNTKIRVLIISVLKSAGFEKITEAENGQQAWQFIQENKFDIVLTDFMMPEMNGLELLKKIRSGEEEYKSTPVLMITASDRSNDIVEAAKWKVNGYIVKPFRIKTVLNKINSVLCG
jgi:two-component system, chemotaxis family, chemotaxis protein CheY